MPIYEFECENCQEQFEVFVTYDAIEKVSCPKCRSLHLKRLISSLGYIKHPDQAHGCPDSTKSDSSSSSSTCSSCSGGSCSTCGK